MPLGVSNNQTDSSRSYSGGAAAAAAAAARELDEVNGLSDDEASPAQKTSTASTQTTRMAARTALIDGPFPFTELFVNAILGVPCGVTMYHQYSSVGAPCQRKRHRRQHPSILNDLTTSITKKVDSTFKTIKEFFSTHKEEFLRGVKLLAGATILGFSVMPLISLIASVANTTLFVMATLAVTAGKVALCGTGVILGLRLIFSEEQTSLKSTA